MSSWTTTRKLFVDQLELNALPAGCENKNYTVVKSIFQMHVVI